jgi:predicted nucleic acid-binding protein
MAVLDTNLVIDIFNGYGPVKEHLRRFSEEELKVTIFTKYEMLRGAIGRDEAKTRQFLDTFGLCGFSDAAMEEAIDIWRRLGNKTIDEMDLLILAISQACGETLITRDGNLGRLGENVVVIKA